MPLMSTFSNLVSHTLMKVRMPVPLALVIFDNTQYLVSPMLPSCCCQLCHQLSSLSVLSRGDSKEWNQEEGLPGSLDQLRWVWPIFLSLSCILETLISSWATSGGMETSRQEKDRIDDLCLLTVCQGVQDCSRSFGVLQKQEHFQFKWGHNSISAEICWLFLHQD